MSLFGFDICPKCGCNNAPMFGLAKIKDGFVRIVLKKRKKKRRRWQIDESSGTNHSNYLHHTCCNMLDW